MALVMTAAGVVGGQVLQGSPGQFPGTGRGAGLGVVGEIGVGGSGLAQPGFHGAQLARVGSRAW